MLELMARRGGFRDLRQSVLMAKKVGWVGASHDLARSNLGREASLLISFQSLLICKSQQRTTATLLQTHILKKAQIARMSTTKVPEASGRDFFVANDKLTDYVLDCSDKENSDPHESRKMKAMTAAARNEHTTVATSLDSMMAEMKQVKSEMETLKAGQSANKKSISGLEKEVRAGKDLTSKLEADIGDLKLAQLVGSQSALRIGEGQMRYDMLTKLRENKKVRLCWTGQSW